MSGPVIADLSSGACGQANAAAPVVGFWGKLPSRGDFVRAGLARGFVDPWDAWLSMVLPESRRRLGEAWLDAWLEAPVWRFALGSGVCGGQAMLGLLLPSVDRAGRYFPLTIAAAYPPGITRQGLVTPEEADVWLNAVEDAALMALETDLTPDALTTMLAGLERPAPDAMDQPGVGLWWSAGAPRVRPRRLELDSLPDGATFATMLDDGSSA